jgi:hypothetical protein
MFSMWFAVLDWVMVKETGKDWATDLETERAKDSAMVKDSAMDLETERGKVMVRAKDSARGTAMVRAKDWVTD